MPRTLKAHVCPDCSAEHQNTSGNVCCNSCAYKRRTKATCADCGAAIDKRSNRCRTCKGRSERGEQSPHWQGGRIVNAQGYVLVKAHDHPKANAANGYYVREHVLVAEAELGRYLTDDEVVHHVDHDRQHNAWSNLLVLTKAEHDQHHADDRPRDAAGNWL